MTNSTVSLAGLKSTKRHQNNSSAPIPPPLGTTEWGYFIIVFINLLYDYITFDQFCSCGCNPDDFDAHFENMQGALRGGAMGEVVSNLSSTIEDVVFNVLNECKNFRTEAE